jgi:hypothetical protein
MSSKEKPSKVEDFSQQREVLREPGQISFKEAMKKMIGTKPKNTQK